MRVVRSRKGPVFLTIAVLTYVCLWITRYLRDTTEHGVHSCAISAFDKTLIKKPPPLNGTIGNVYDLNGTLPAEADDIICVVFLVRPRTRICLHPPGQDVIITESLLEDGTWEADQVAAYQWYMSKFPEMGVIDIGSNIGVYTLAAAKAGHKVLAIEPNRANALRIHKAASLDSTVRANIKLLLNAVGDVREKATLTRNEQNQGGIAINVSQAKIHPESAVVNVMLMDDLVPYVDFKLAIMKIDIEGFEARAFVHAEKLFATVNIPVVLMEWGLIKPYLTAPSQGWDCMLLKRMVDFFTVRHYEPFSHGNELLDMDTMAQWPWDILWIKNQTVFF